MNTLYLRKARLLLVKIGNDISVHTLDFVSQVEYFSRESDHSGGDEIDAHVINVLSAIVMVVFASHLGWKKVIISTYNAGASLARLNYNIWQSTKRSITVVRVGPYPAKQYGSRLRRQLPDRKRGKAVHREKFAATRFD